MIYVSFWTSLTIIFLSSSPYAQESQTQFTRPTEVVLTDQFEKTHRVSAFRGHVVVMVYGDRKGSDLSRKLGEQVFIHFHPTAKGKTPKQAQAAPVRPIPNWPKDLLIPDVKVIPVACTGKIPPFLHRFIRKQFRRGVPDVPVWIDMENLMADQFGLNAGVPNLIVIDTWGFVRYRNVGIHSPEQFQGLVNAIEALRREPLTLPTQSKDPVQPNR